MGKITEAFTWAGRQVEKGLEVTAKKAGEAKDGAVDYLVHESHRQQARRARIGDYHSAYIDARSFNLKKQSSGLEKLHEIVGYGESQIPPKEFAKLMRLEYGDASAEEYFKHWR